MTMTACIHRGAAQVGGTCIELEASGQRLLLDLGMPLDAEPGALPFPAVRGLDGSDPSLLGIVVSHLHGDHCGLIPFISPRIPLAMGPVAARLHEAARFFTGAPVLPGPSWPLLDRTPFDVGPFRVTPYRVEHGPADAFAVLVEAAGRRLFYTGDLRAHGNDAEPMRRLLADPPRGVHSMLMEGTLFGDGREIAGRSEAELGSALAQRFREWPDIVLASWSSQHLDRLRTFHAAARAAGRTLVVDLYTATLAREAQAGGLPDVPAPGDDGLAVYCRRREIEAIKSSGEYERTRWLQGCRLFVEDLAPRGRELVLMVRPSMLAELEWAGALPEALAIWSMWAGYLAGPTERRLLAAYAEHGVEVEVHHVSGHAYEADLARLAAAVAPEQLVPVHTERPERYAHLNVPVSRHADGERWGV